MPVVPGALPGSAGQLKSGISGIERNIARRHVEADKSISAAFEDLSALMDKAREMVALSGNISAKIRSVEGRESRGYWRILDIYIVYVMDVIN